MQLCWPFLWVLGIQTQILKHTAQALLPTDPLPQLAPLLSCALRAYEGEHYLTLGQHTQDLLLKKVTFSPLTVMDAKTTQGSMEPMALLHPC